VSSTGLLDKATVCGRSIGREGFTVVLLASNSFDLDRPCNNGAFRLGLIDGLETSDVGAGNFGHGNETVCAADVTFSNPCNACDNNCGEVCTTEADDPPDGEVCQGYDTNGVETTAELLITGSSISLAKVGVFEVCSSTDDRLNDVTTGVN